MTTVDTDYETDEERDEREAREAAERQGGNHDKAARRRAEKERDDERARAEKAEAALAKRDRHDALTRTFADLGIDTSKGVGKLFAAQYANTDGEVTADAVRAAILADPDLAETFNVGPDPRDEAARTQAITATGGGVGDNPSQITPETFIGWDLPTRVRFMEEHPNAYEALATGEPVTTPAGW